MIIQKLRVKDLEPNEGQIQGLPVNPRQWTKEDIEKISKSLQETPELFEMRPCIVYPLQDKFVILGGNLRFQGAKKNKEKEIPCIVIDKETSLDKLKEIVIKDNGSFGSWDFDALANEWDDLPLTDWGVPAWNSEDASEDATDAPQEAKEDDFDEDTDQVEKRAERGSIWILGEHRLMCGSATSADDIADLIGADKIDLLETDPPYGINVVGNNGEVGANFGIAKKGNYSKVIADDTTDTARDAMNLLLPMCKKAVVWGGNYFVDFLPFSDGWLIWDKRGESGIRNTFADGEMAWCSFHTPVRIYHQLWNGMIREGEHEKRVHPTQKPVRMLSEVIRDFSDEGNIVLDVFGGSGSTMMACEQMSRSCYMMELDPHYCDVILARWEKMTGKKAEQIK